VGLFVDDPLQRPRLERTAGRQHAEYRWLRLRNRRMEIRMRRIFRRFPLRVKAPSTSLIGLAKGFRHGRLCGVCWAEVGSGASRLCGVVLGLAGAECWATGRLVGAREGQAGTVGHGQERPGWARQAGYGEAGSGAARSGQSGRCAARIGVALSGGVRLGRQGAARQGSAWRCQVG
jgi:hypothetical protein